MAAPPAHSQSLRRRSALPAWASLLLRVALAFGLIAIASRSTGSTVRG